MNITCDIQTKYTLDGIILPIGAHIEDYVEEMLKFVMQHLSIRMVLFDRGFASWGIIYKLRKLSIPYLIFWEKRSKWYSELFENMNDGEYVYVKRDMRRKNMIGFLPPM